MTTSDEPRRRERRRRVRRRARRPASPSGSPRSTTTSPSSARRALRAGLADYELDDEDLELLEAAAEGPEGITYLPALPVLAIVGPPERRQVGARQPHPRPPRGRRRGHPRRHARPRDLQGRVDRTAASRSSTPAAGSPTRKGINASVAAQAEVAIDLADAVLFVVDATVGATATDEHVVRMLRASKRPGHPGREQGRRRASRSPQAAALWSLGLGEPWPVSALHGRGVADLLDHVMTVLPEVSAVAKHEIGGPRRVAILGRPNVGKSLAAEQGRRRGARRRQRARRHHPRPGRRAGRARRQDLALRRHRRHPPSRAPAAGRRLLRVAAHLAPRSRRPRSPSSCSTSPSRSREQDLRIIDLVLESGRALVLAFNKWDLLDDDAPPLPRARDRAGPRARRLGAAREHLGAHRAPPREARAGARDRARQSWDTRIPTGKFNALLAELAAEHPHPVRGGKQPRILFGTQAVDPPADVRAVHDRIPRPAATAASSSAACARSTASRARRSSSTCGCARSGSASTGA